MTHVYLVVGWFGDVEWVEAVYATDEAAEAACRAAWQERRSAHAPDWCQGLCKFGVEEWPVRVAVEA